MPAGAEPVTRVIGPAPGLLGDIVALHGRYYAQHWQFPFAFESGVARAMASFLDRYDPACDLVLSVRGTERWLGSITLDASDPALRPGEAHLRWFILDPDLHGRGLGHRLLGEAIAFARTTGIRSVYLTTFRGLDRAFALYTAAGFRVVEERLGRNWGAEVVELTLELTLRRDRPGEKRP